MDNAIIYCRVSTEEQAKDGHHSMATQENQCRKLASTYNIIKIFKDPGKSGGDIKRPGLLEMLDYIKNNKIQALFIQHTDRLARDVIIHHEIKKELSKNGVELHTASGGKIEDTPEGKMADGMMAVVNEYHKNITSYKTLKAMQNKAESGWLPGEAPLGYKNVGIGAEGKIRVIEKDPVMSPLIKLAFKVFSTGSYSIEALIDILYAKGFRSKRGFKISKSKMNYTLKNPFYIGELHWGKTYLKKAKHKPLVSRELFNAVQKVFAEHNHHACRRRKYSFLLRGFLYCTCGSRMTAGKFKNKIWSYYFCNNRKECDESYVPVEKLEKQTESLFKRIQFSDDFINLIMEKVKIGYQEMQQSNKQQKQNLINQKTAIEHQRDKAEEKLLEGIINNKDFSRLRNKIQDQLDGIETLLSELHYQRELDVDQIQEILNFTKNIYSAYQKASPELKRQYLGLFFDKIFISNKKIKSVAYNSLFDTLIKAEKAFYKAQKPSNKGRGCVSSTVPYLNPSVKIRTEWGD